MVTRETASAAAAVASTDTEPRITPANARARHIKISRHEHVRERTGSRPVVRLAGLAVVRGPHSTTQAEALQCLGLSEDEFALGIFDRCGVERRHLNLDPDFLASNLQGRTAEVEQELLRQATRAIDQLEIDPRSIGTVLSSTLYSLGCPSLAHRLIEHYGMATSTDKYHITGVGCASAVPLLRLGAQILQADPAGQVLVVAAESMSSILMPAQPEDPRTKTVGSAIFGDGCAAALLSSSRTAVGPAILATRVHQIPGSLDAVQITTDSRESHLELERELPDIAVEGLAELVHDFLGASGLSEEAVDHWILHPGGRRIVECARDALRLSDEQVATSWRTLAEHGNVGTPSIFYVIESTIQDRRPAAGEFGLAITIGPGVSVGLMLLQF